MSKVACWFVVFGGMILGGCHSAPSQKKVTIAIWSRYLPDNFSAEFEQATGIVPHITTFSSNEEVLAKLQAGFTGYDVIVPSDYMVSIMSQLGLLAPLDLKKVANFKNIAPQFLNQPFDPNNKYSIPYDWSAAGLAINRAFFKAPLRSWKELALASSLKKRLSLLDDAREVLGAALLTQGAPFNSTDPTQLQSAKNWLMGFRDGVKFFTSEAVVPLSTGEIWVAHMFASDAMYCKYVLKKDIEFVFPEEGFTLTIDNMVITKNSTHSQEAYALMNYLLEPQVSQHLTQKVFLSPVCPGVFAKLEPTLQQEQAIFPSAEILKRAQTVKDIKEATVLFDRMWTEIKSGV